MMEPRKNGDRGILKGNSNGRKRQKDNVGRLRLPLEFYVATLDRRMLIKKRFNEVLSMDVSVVMLEGKFCQKKSRNLNTKELFGYWHGMA